MRIECNKERVEEKWGKAMKAARRRGGIHLCRVFGNRKRAIFFSFLADVIIFPSRGVVAAAAPVFALAASSLWKSEI